MSHLSVQLYARVSTADQDLTLQRNALKAAGCETIREEKASGTSTKGRTELAILREFMRKGDTLVVTRIDRLARSIGDLQDIVRSLKEKGIALKATEQPIDTSTAAGKAFLDMLGVFAEFETNLRRERQLEGIAKAKALGVYKGRKPSVDAAKVRELQAAGIGPTAIAEKLQIGRASVYRVLNAQRSAYVSLQTSFRARCSAEPVVEPNSLVRVTVARLPSDHVFVAISLRLMICAPSTQRAWANENSRCRDATRPGKRE